jgi:ankyrin repeat protein
MSYPQGHRVLTTEQMDEFVRSPWGLISLMRTYTPFGWSSSFNHLKERHYKVAMSTAAAHMNSQRYPDFIGYFLKRRDREDIQEMIDIALSMAVSRGHISSVKELLETYPTPPKTTMTRLVSIAAKYGHLPTLFLLIRKGAVPDHSAVIQSIRKGHANISRFLIEHNKKPRAEKGGGGWLKMTPQIYEKCLRLAIKQFDEEIVKLYLEEDVSVDIEKLGFVLWWACVLGKPKTVKTLLSRGGLTIYEQTNYSVKEAIHKNYLEIVKLYLDYGKSPSPDLLKIAIKDNHPDIVRLLVDYGADCTELTQKDEQDILDYWYSNEKAWLNPEKQKEFRERYQAFRGYIPINPRRVGGCCPTIERQ